MQSLHSKQANANDILSLNHGDHYMTPKGNVIIYKNGIEQNTEQKQPKIIPLKNAVNGVEDVLQNAMLKEKALSLCKEHEELSQDGGDTGFITFIQKYLSPQTVKKMFATSGIEEITNLNELKSILALSIIIYKAQVQKIKNMVFDGLNANKTRFSKSDIKSVAKYLSVWIIKNYGDETYDDDQEDDNGEDQDEEDEIYITQQEYTEKLAQYLSDFVRLEWKSFNSSMDIHIHTK